MTPPFAAHSTRRFYLHDRQEAGAALGAELAQYAHRDDMMILGLPHGGVPAAADALGAPLDVWLVRKLGVRAAGPAREL